MPSRACVARNLRRLSAAAIPLPADPSEIGESWLTALSDLDDDRLSAAVTRHLRTSRSFPTPAELLA